MLKQCCWTLKFYIKLEGFILCMIRPTLSPFFGQIFVDTSLHSYWLLDFPCSASERKDASGRPGLNEPIVWCIVCIKLLKGHLPFS